MNILLVHNAYGTFTGEEAVVRGQAELLERKGHLVYKFYRSSEETFDMRFGQIRAFFSGIYNVFSRLRFLKLLSQEKPDLVHIHNLYPFISPSVLSACTEAGVPLVMTVHNYRLMCANGLFFSHGQICERCIGPTHELNCILHNCLDSFPKSLGYALRNYVARQFWLYKRHVTCFAVLTDFQRRKLIEARYPESRIYVVPNMVGVILPRENNEELGHYVGYAGRLSPEKGIDIILETAGKLGRIPVKFAGNGMNTYMARNNHSNVEFLGRLPRNDLQRFLQKARMIVMASIWYEGFPMALAEAMLHRKPVIAPRLGGFPEIVDDGRTGLLFEPGNVEDLACKIQTLWNDPQLCREMGEAGYQKVVTQYSPEKYYQRLMDVYKEALRLGAGAPSSSSLPRPVQFGE